MSLSLLVKGLISILLIFLLKIPVKYALLSLDLMDYYVFFCGIYSCLLVILFSFVDRKNLPDMLYFMTIFTLSVFWAFIILHFFKFLPQEFVINIFSILSSFTLFADSVEGHGVNTGSANTGSTNTIEESKASKQPKKKPELSVKTGPNTELEKDKEKIGKCTHDKLSNFKIDKEEEVESTLCDFEGENNKPDHQAFDSVTDNAFICDSCHGILCKDCVEDYSDEE